MTKRQSKFRHTWHITKSSISLKMVASDDLKSCNNIIHGTTALRAMNSEIQEQITVENAIRVSRESDTVARR